MSSRVSPFVVDAVEEFLRGKAAREPKTRAAYSGVLLGSERGTKKPLGLPLAVYFHNRKFNTVTHDEVSIWFAQRVKGGRQPTKHRISKAARAFFRFARERGYTKLDLASAIAPFRAGGPRVEWLEWDEVHRLLAAIPEWRYRFAAAWLFFTGCRVQEACDALQDEVRWRAEAEFFQWTISVSKTHNPRVVWIPPVLGEYIEESRRVNNPHPDWPVLWDCEGRGFGRVENPAARITPRTINNALERARDAAHLPMKISAHVARHTYATNWIREHGESEISMVKLSRQVGTSVAVLRSTYVHIDLTDEDWEHLRTMGSRSF